MKTRGILLFILSIFVMLAVICMVFPEGGVPMKFLTLHFPALSDILNGGEEEAKESPDDLLAKRLAAISKAGGEDFMEYYGNNPARIYLPADDLTFFDSLFAALDSAGSRRVRIVHYGDSQIEEDRISSTLRDSLQTVFGGGGPGLLPVVDQYYSLSITEASSAAPLRYSVFGPAELRSDDNRYGPLARKSHFDGTVTTAFFPVKHDDSPSRRFNRLTLLSSGGDVTVSCNGVTLNAEASSDIRYLRFEFPFDLERISFTHSGSHDVYGVTLDCETGVSLDNVPMRGNSGTIFTDIDAAQLSDYYNTENVRLIILEYGGNAIPHTKTGEEISKYCKVISRQISYLKGLAPRAKILYIGPADMATGVQGKMQSYANLPEVVDSLRVTACRSGAAYWDMFAAMGGEGTMVQWVRQAPPLASEDYIHFTRTGAAKIGELLYRTLMLYYDQYRIRNNDQNNK